jgi:hypothetical protein
MHYAQPSMNIILSVIGAVFIAIGGGLAYWQYTVIQGKLVTEGKVVALDPHQDSEGSTLYTIIAEFRDTAGNQHTYRSGFSSSNPGYNIGDKIRIFYDRKNPLECGIMSFGYRFGAAWCLIVAGLALFLIMAGWHYGNQWMLEKFTTAGK